MKWDPEIAKNDERFKNWDLAPKGKADYAFILDGIANLKDSGIMAVILPHGVLFRGTREGKIRRELIDANYLDAVIGLPEKLFDVTGIPVCIMIFKKNRKTDDIFFIDASNEFEKGKNQNKLTDEHIQKIFKTYQERKTVDKYASVVSMDEIKENDYNLNIPRYVDTFEEESPVDVKKLRDNYKKLDKQEKELVHEINGMMDDLVATTPESQETLDTLKDILK
ncbi:N-6 DNA methylase [Fructilactobacillus hinvesii]|uniref:N-6 DNA methylase n=1 Tax=Fructilactobacillus hinvesii TaxID=2940300 RepID=UPI0020923B71|nr:N-6 DNA methylase [Fructilactobacillus hinvesii]